MAKELPYFQFEPAEYISGNISFCSISAQGLFINICSYYWQRNCLLTKEQVLRRLNLVDEFDELLQEKVIYLDVDNYIKIKFLDDQKSEIIEKSNKNKVNGSKGGRPKKTQTKANANPIETQTKGIREDDIKKEDIKVNYIYNQLCLSDDVWMENICRMNKTKVDIIKNMLSKFDSHLITVEETKKNLKEYKQHFSNWIRKQELTTKRINLGI